MIQGEAKAMPVSARRISSTWRLSTSRRLLDHSGFAGHFRTPRGLATLATE